MVFAIGFSVHIAKICRFSSFFTKNCKNLATLDGLLEIMSARELDSTCLKETQDVFLFLLKDPSMTKSLRAI